MTYLKEETTPDYETLAQLIVASFFILVMLYLLLMGITVLWTAYLKIQCADLGGIDYSNAVRLIPWPGNLTCVN